MIMKIIRLSMFIGVLSCAALADNLPEPTLPAGVGVHFNEIYLKDINDEKDLEMIAAAGFRLVREDFRLDKIERNRGEYDWSEYDRIAAGLERHGLRPYFILCYSNPLYEQAVTNLNPAGGGANRVTLSPQHLESIAAYARWAAAAAEHFHGQRVIWEIWNEPNGVSFWKPKPDAAQYTALALAAAKAIRTTDPQACLVAPATARRSRGTTQVPRGRERARKAELADKTGKVTPGERTGRYGNTGAIVAVGPRIALAELVERKLFDRGCLVARAESEEAAQILEAVGMIAVLASEPEIALPADDKEAAAQVINLLEQDGVLLAGDVAGGEGI